MKRTGRTSDVLRRAVSIFMIAAMLMMLCSCSIKSRIREIGGDDYIEAPELVRLVINAVKAESNLSDAYSQIPEQQRGGVSYSYLKEYTDILRRLSRVNGSIMSFRLLNDDQIDVLLDGFWGGDSGSEILRERYGKLGCAQFLYSSETDQPVYLFFSYDNNGHAVLSSSWISGIIGIYNYADHYFSMLEEQNVEGVYTLLRPAYEDSGYSDEVIYSKAQALADYYLINVRSTQAQFVISGLSPVKYEICIPETVDPLTGSIEEHIMSVMTDDSENFYIEDNISQEIDSSVSYVYRDSSRLLRCGTSYTMNSVSGIMGKWMYTSHITNDQGDFMLVYYPGMSLRFSLNNITEFSWDGKLTEVRLYGDTYSAGSVIKVGNTVDDILRVYPFIDVADYDIIYDSGYSKVKVTFEHDDNGVITSVTVSEI